MTTPKGKMISSREPTKRPGVNLGARVIDINHLLYWISLPICILVNALNYFRDYHSQWYGDHRYTGISLSVNCIRRNIIWSSQYFHYANWDIGDNSRFSLSCLGPLVLLLPKILFYLTFQFFDFERTWWKLFQKRAVRTTFDIYIFIPANIRRDCLYLDTGCGNWLICHNCVKCNNTKKNIPQFLNTFKI